MNQFFQTAIGLLLFALGFILLTLLLVGALDIPPTPRGEIGDRTLYGFFFTLLLVIGGVLLLKLPQGESTTEIRLRQERNNAENDLTAAKTKLHNIYLLVNVAQPGGVFWNNYPHDKEYVSACSGIQTLRVALEEARAPCSVKDPEAFVAWLHDKLIDDEENRENRDDEAGT